MMFTVFTVWHGRCDALQQVAVESMQQTPIKSSRHAFTRHINKGGRIGLLVDYSGHESCR